jgi:AraC-like DNA-binding protein
MPRAHVKVRTVNADAVGGQSCHVSLNGHMTQVSILAIRALAAAVEEAGAARDRFLAEAGIATSQLHDPFARISLAHYARARRAALIASGDPALGLHMGGLASTGRYDLFAALVEHSSCLREAFQLITRYSRIVLEGPRVELAEQGSLATVRYFEQRSDSPELRMAAEFVTSSLLFLMRRFLGDDAEPRRVAFSYPEPSYRAEYTRVFRGREQFAQDFIGIEFDRAWLDQEQTYRSPELCALLKSRAELLLARSERDAPAAERVRRWLAASSLEHRPSMDAIARDLGMSARSLRRRLSGERAPYAALVEDARATRAKSLLEDQRLSVQEAAYALGFDTPTAFSRAFKRWTGMAPSAYRAR